MEKIESLEEFYQRKFNWIPENLKNDQGHFNLFRALQPIQCEALFGREAQGSSLPKT